MSALQGKICLSTTQTNSLVSRSSCQTQPHLVSAQVIIWSSLQWVNQLWVLHRPPRSIPTWSKAPLPSLLWAFQQLQIHRLGQLIRMAWWTRSQPTCRQIPWSMESLQLWKPQSKNRLSQMNDKLHTKTSQMLCTERLYCTCAFVWGQILNSLKALKLWTRWSKTYSRIHWKKSTASCG